jgi:hypothetical protein
MIASVYFPSLEAFEAVLQHPTNAEVMNENDIMFFTRHPLRAAGWRPAVDKLAAAGVHWARGLRSSAGESANDSVRDLLYLDR